MALDKTSEAVEALHQTMVMLREELAKKNAKIRLLETQLNSNLETISIQPENIKNEVNFQQRTEVKHEEVISDDLVHDFQISDDEEENEQVTSSKDVKIHTLIVHKDIDVHNPPPSSSYIKKKSGVTFCNLRPIVRPPSASPRSCTGSQTDVSALSPGILDQNTGKTSFYIYPK